MTWTTSKHRAARDAVVGKRAGWTETYLDEALDAIEERDRLLRRVLACLWHPPAASDDRWMIAEGKAKTFTASIHEIRAVLEGREQG